MTRSKLEVSKTLLYKKTRNGLKKIPVCPLISKAGETFRAKLIAAPISVNSKFPHLLYVTANNTSKSELKLKNFLYTVHKV